MFFFHSVMADSSSICRLGTRGIVTQALHKDAEAALRLSKQRMQVNVGQCHKPYTFNVGDKVWLQAKQIKIHQQSAKLGPKQLGPFEVIEVRSDVDYKLALP